MIMGLFKRKSKLSDEERESLIKTISENKSLIGVNPELVNSVKLKVKQLKDERDILKKDYDELIKRMSVVEGKCDAINDTFKNFKSDLMKDFLEEARKVLNKELKIQTDANNNNHKRIMKIEDELIKINKAHDDLEFISSFQDYYQLVKLCIYMITNASPSNHEFIALLLQTIHSMVDDMRRNNFWSTGRDAIITSLLNLKTFWRSRDSKVEGLIGAEIDALESLR